MDPTPNKHKDNLSASAEKVRLHIAELSQEKQSIEAELNSWTKSFERFFGLASTNKPTGTLNSTNSPEELEEKITELEEEISLNEEILQSLNLELADIAREERVRQHEEQERLIINNRNALEEEFKEDPNKFYASVLPKAPISQLDTKSVYNNAEKIIAACGAFPSETNRYKLIEAWSVVQEARNRAFDRYRDATKNPSIDTNEIRKLSNENDKFYNGAKYVFNTLVDKGPSGLQGAKFLYDRRMFEDAEWYLNRAVVDQKLIDKLTNQVNDICRNLAMASLQSMLNFNRLPLDVQEQLINQQAFITKYSFDLEAIPPTMHDAAYQKLQSYKELFRSNISNVIANYRSETDVNAQFLKIQKQIDDESAVIRQHWFKKQLKDNLTVSLGSGLGIAWLIGAGSMPIGVAVGLAINSQLSTFDVSENNLQIPSVEEKAVLLNQVDPQDYEFIQRTKAEWGTVKPISETDTPVQFKSAIEQASEKIQDATDSVKSQIKQKADAAWKEHVDPIVTDANSKAVSLYGGIIGVSLIILAVLVVALPAAWPVYAIVAGGAFIGFSYLLAKKAQNPHKQYGTFLAPLVNATYNSIIRNGNNIKRAGYFIFVQPFKSVGQYISNYFTNQAAASSVIKFANSDNNESNQTFALPAASMQVLEKMSPHFGIQLGRNLIAHFEARANKIRDLIKDVQAQPNSAFSAAEMGDINTKLSELESDWQDIKLASEKPTEFLKTVEAYLDKRFVIEQNEYIKDAQARKKLGYDIKLKRNTMLFDDINDKTFKITLPENAVDIAEKQRALEELLRLKDNFGRFKREY